MKRTVLSVICLMYGLIAAAQSVDGFELGSYYSHSQILSSLRHARTVSADNGYQIFISGNSSLSFDFTGAYESNDGRFADADICDANHIVEFPFGQFKVGDSLVSLLQKRAGFTFSGYDANVCQISYTVKGNRTSVLLQFGAGQIITEISGFVAEKVKKEKADTPRSGFYNAVTEIDVNGNALSAGNSIAKLLELGLDVDFTGLGNGLCKITFNDGKGEKSYLVRYGMDHIIKEMLAL